MREIAWEEEHLYFDGDAFFDALEKGINEAHHTIDLESYIFENDNLGRRVTKLLTCAAKRGIAVRIIVDGLGSLNWEGSFGAPCRQAGIPFKVFHKIGLGRFKEGAWSVLRLRGLRHFLLKLNSRNHRKVCIIDGHLSWLGSMNITDAHLRSQQGEKAWRDTGVMVRGSSVDELVWAFERVWMPRRKRLATLLQKRHLIFLRPKIHPEALVRLNTTRGLRRGNYRELLRRIRRASRRIWITNSYFVPHGSLLRALENAAARGVDVRILVPHNSDHFFMPWVTSSFYYGLLKRGVRIFEYLPTILHAKTLAIDEWCIVGSSNLNHRSLLHDLEADVRLTNPHSLQTMEQNFLKDLAHSEEVRFDVWQRRNPVIKVLGRIVLAFRYFL